MQPKLRFIIAHLDLRQFAPAVLVILLSIGFATSAQSAGSSGGADEFNAADANHDGKLSRNEASDYLVNKIFNSRDANHDGRMTPKEWGADDPGQMAEFKKRDANHDGIVTKQEALAYGRAHGIANQLMKEADTNHDGYLSRKELQAYYASREGPPN
jgi:hypothetical protein